MPIVRTGRAGLRREAWLMDAPIAAGTLIDVQPVDYLIIAFYFAVVLGIGVDRAAPGLGLGRLLPLRAARCPRG